MSNAGITSGAADRYASAAFALAEEQGALDAVAADLTALEGMLADSDALRHLVFTPAYSRDDQGRAVAAVADKADFNTLTRNTLGLMARNGRLGLTEGLIAAYRQRLADLRGETTAEVTSARPLSDMQQDALAAALKERLGKDVALTLAVDPSLLGGMVVRVGSKMIDSSLKAKLATLQTAMISAYR